MFADELGALYPDFGGARPAVIRSVLTGDEKWCDDVTTAPVETCDQIVTAAWGDTVAWLKDNGHTDVDKVHWSAFHIATFRHLLFGNFPGIGGFGALEIPTGGDTYTVNRGTFLSSTSRAPFRHIHGSSLRAIYDLSDLAASRFALPGGQSGQMASAHYGDLLTDWRDGRYFTQPTTATIVDTLTLNPAETGPR
jgi:penicillin amidase